jgi:hypothetical protein
MARKVFVSYKYADNQVERLPEPLNNYGTCRDYVDLIMQTIEGTEIYNGEDGDNDLSRFSDETIKTHLKYLIRHSSITVVLISKGMKEQAKPENEQWIPWEIQYSLTRRAYGMQRTKRNGMLAVILPDENGSYDHYFSYSNCAHCNSRTHKIENLFQMLGKNMFNIKKPIKTDCTSPSHDSSYHIGDTHSYIHQVEWHKFIKNPSHYIDIAEQLKGSVDNYDLKKRVTA